MKTQLILLILSNLLLTSCGDTLKQNIALKSKYLNNTEKDDNSMSILAINAPGGPLAGGNTVSITGKNFATGITVYLGTALCTNIQLVSSTEISCVASAHSEDLVDVILFNSSGKRSILENGYSYQPAPTISSITPTLGSNLGGTQVTITGDHFKENLTVTVGSGQCRNITYISETEIKCFTSYHASGTVTVTATNFDLQYGTLPGNYTFQSEPTYGLISSFGSYQTNNNHEALTGSNFNTSNTLIDLFYQLWAE